MKTYIKTYDNQITKKDCKFLIKTYDENQKEFGIRGRVYTKDEENALHPAKKCREIFLKGQDNNKQLLKAEDITKEAITKCFQKYIADCPNISDYIESHKKSIKTTQYQLRKYEVGDGFYWHVDSSRHHHLLACIVYLNKVKKGGETRFRFSSKNFGMEEHDVIPEPGKILMFPAN